MRRFVIPFMACLALGCGPGAAEPETAAGGEEATGGQAGAEPTGDEPGKGKPSAIETIGIGPPEQPWEEMSFDDREFYMIGKVLPITKELFTDFDSRTFEDFGCETCHGEDGEDRDFAMPDESLPPVPAPGTDDWADMERDQPRMVRFMEKKITPSMATMIGMEVAEEGGGTGFSCNGCHPTP